MSKINDTITAIEDYFFDLRSDARRFEEKGNMSAGTRARKSAAAVMKLCKELREAIQQAKNDAKV